MCLCVLSSVQTERAPSCEGVSKTVMMLGFHSDSLRCLIFPIMHQLTTLGTSGSEHIAEERPRSLLESVSLHNVESYVYKIQDYLNMNCTARHAEVDRPIRAPLTQRTTGN